MLLANCLPQMYPWMVDSPECCCDFLGDATVDGGGAKLTTCSFTGAAALCVVYVVVSWMSRPLPTFIFIPPIMKLMGLASGRLTRRRGSGSPSFRAIPGTYVCLEAAMLMLILWTHVHLQTLKSLFMLWYRPASSPTSQCCFQPLAALPWTKWPTTIVSSRQCPPSCHRRLNRETASKPAENGRTVYVKASTITMEFSPSTSSQLIVSRSVVRAWRFFDVFASCFLQLAIASISVIVCSEFC